MKRIIEQTSDGSPTLYVPALDEHYHSVKGAHTESSHIFIDMGLKASVAPKPRVLEVGFGTGLNAWLTLLHAEAQQLSVHYTGIERYPLTWDEIAPLHYSEDPLFRQLHQVAWNEDVSLTTHFTLHKAQEDIYAFLHQQQAGANGYDVVYYDAFAPEKQPEMWDESLFRHIYQLMNPGGILTTYCAKGVIRRMWQSIGFEVERLPGPPGGKREILRGRKML